MMTLEDMNVRNKEYDKAYHLKNKERRNAQSRAYHEANKEKDNANAKVSDH